MLEEAEWRSRERPQIARHVATILLDGACEYAMGISVTHAGLSVPPRAKEGGFFARRDILSERYKDTWPASGWTGVTELHEARNAAQHRGTTADPDDLARWSRDAESFVRSLCAAVFGVELLEVTLSDALVTASVREHLLDAERALRESDAVRSFESAMLGFDDALARWREQRSDLRGPISIPTGRFSIGVSEQVAGAIEQLWELVEIQPFAGELGEYVWLRARRAEFGEPGATLTLDDASRAFRFAFLWALRWEGFATQYTAPRWAERTPAEPPRSGRDNPEPLIWEIVKVEGARPRLDEQPLYEVWLQLADVPALHRDQWAMFLHKALNESAPRAGSGLQTDYARVTDTGLVSLHQVPIEREPTDLIARVTAAIKTAQAEYDHALALQADWEGQHEQLLEPYRRALGAVEFAVGQPFLGDFSARGLTDEFVVVATPAVENDSWTLHDFLVALSHVVGGYEGDVRYDDGTLTFRSALKPHAAAELARAIAAHVAASRSERAAKQAELDAGRERLESGLQDAIAERHDLS
jgi:hypothetical protein